MKMNRLLEKAIVAGVLIVTLTAVFASPKDDDDGVKDVRSPAIEDDFPTFEDEQPTEFSIGSLITGRVGKFFNDFLQWPSALFRFISGVVARQPFAKLREEVRNLNISYPK